MFVSIVRKVSSKVRDLQDGEHSVMQSIKCIPARGLDLQLLICHESKAYFYRRPVLWEILTGVERVFISLTGKPVGKVLRRFKGDNRSRQQDDD